MYLKIPVAKILHSVRDKVSRHNQTWEATNLETTTPLLQGGG